MFEKNKLVSVLQSLEKSIHHPLLLLIKKVNLIHLSLTYILCVARDRKLLFVANEEEMATFQQNKYLHTHRN